MKGSRKTPPGDDTGRKISLPFQFITENGRDGRRPPPGSTAMFSIRSQARRYRALQEDHRKNLLREKCGKNRSLKNKIDQPSDPPESEDTQIVVKSPVSYLECQFQWSIAKPQTILGAGRIDPFRSYPVKAEPYMDDLVDHFATFLRRDAMIWQKERGEKVTGYHRLTNVWIPLCRTNALAFHALLLVAETDRRLSFNQNPWSMIAVKLLAKCIKLMKVEIGNPKSLASDAMIVSTIMLAWSEVCCRDRQAHVLFKCSCFNQETTRGLEKYRDHMKGIEEMVRIRGGLEKLDTFLKEIILCTDQMAGEPIWGPKFVKQEASPHQVEENIKFLQPRSWFVSEE